MKEYKPIRHGDYTYFFRCLSCKSEMETDDSYFPKEVVCPSCNKVWEVESDFHIIKNEEVYFANLTGKEI